MEFELSYFKFYKMMMLNCFTQYFSKIGKLSSGHRIGKCQFSFPSPKRQWQRIYKLQLCLFLMLARLCSKSFKLDLNSMNWEYPDIQYSLDHRESNRIPGKNICFIDCVKAFDCVDHKLWKILEEIIIPGHLTYLLRNLTADQKQQFQSL